MVVDVMCVRLMTRSSVRGVKAERSASITQKFRLIDFQYWALRENGVKVGRTYAFGVKFSTHGGRPTLNVGKT